jgi:hypothetical protein
MHAKLQEELRTNSLTLYKKKPHFLQECTTPSAKLHEVVAGLNAHAAQGVPKGTLPFVSRATCSPNLSRPSSKGIP